MVIFSISCAMQVQCKFMHYQVALLSCTVRLHSQVALTFCTTFFHYFALSCCTNFLHYQVALTSTTCCTIMLHYHVYTLQVALLSCTNFCKFSLKLFFFALLTLSSHVYQGCTLQYSIFCTLKLHILGCTNFANFLKKSRFHAIKSALSSCRVHFLHYKLLYLLALSKLHYVAVQVFTKLLH